MRNKLIALRGDRKRKEIANTLSITPQMLGAIERGNRNPSLELAISLAKLYNITLDDLIFLLNIDT
ncbi:helix-turn-helix transcriptional regulator [Clostridium butyricum]|uniref:Helix-turn-helix domain-containing protein n=1 Tax=Clostridium butyricum TaxID=1492 RepID=A0AAP9RG81_CLOBU|nr:helix-turn-helix domain-containing protein [Clostridium butyricum]MBZ5746923.1 helix-turn-helix domain-containing protein [Clostridium butyricum]MDI9208022.1 helix-turn-helix domain-containing protein [Clostridium butyricum]QGH21766.1 helix-turn-helix domain-containing protein [Clostridium butyricum]QGH25805.1 helix-turn-helix domain-containing protein [Clostridium butyricum]QMW91815.1 helix-turn-helix domain-containing protein [Clostridium butyricum]